MVAEKNILIVDDEAAIREMLSTCLKLSGFNCQLASNAQEAHGKIIDQVPDLLILDWMMPGTSGIELARRLKRDELTASLPIIMLTAKSEEDNKVQGLEAGADDYVTKPFSPKELVARIKAVLRRTGALNDDTVIDIDGLQLDTSNYSVSIQGNPIGVGPTEFRMLKFFMTHPNKVFSRSQLLDHIWGGNVYVDERTVDVHIRRLRKVLSVTAEMKYKDFIQTVRGAGYRFSNKIPDKGRS